MKEMPDNAVDTTIKIKVNRFGAFAKAYLSYRPYLLEMLEELYTDFELILYTCGTSQYAAAFSESVHKSYLEKNPSKPQDFQFFDHVLSL
jgi:hypothetical protein